MSLLDLLARRVPPGMTRVEAELAGLVPPPGWRPPPRDRARDMVRTWTVVARLALRLYREAGPAGAPATTSADGMARIRAACRDLLAELGVEVVVSGVERVPAGGVIFMWNQTSHLDHLVLPLAIPRPFHLTFNNEVRRTPLYGRYLERTGHFWLDRTDQTQWRAALAGAAAQVREGAAVLVSPEGTRSWDGRLLPMKRGAFLLARAAERPIVCLTVCGARERLPRGRAAVRPGLVRVVVEPPIPVTPASSPDLEQRVIDTFERTLRS